MMQSLFRLIAAGLSIYMVIIFIRILLTWFQGVHYGRAYEILGSITDPYLNWFRSHLPIRLGMLDFSPVAGILILGILTNIFGQLAMAATITFGYILAIIVSALWSVVSFFLVLFLILGVIRLIGVIGRFDGGGRMWNVIEQLVNPMIQQLVRPLLRGRFTSYRDSLLIFDGVLLVALVAGNLVVNPIIGALASLPF